MMQMGFGRELGDAAFHEYNRVMGAINFRITTLLPVLPPGFHRHKKAWFDALEAAQEQCGREPEGTSMAHLLLRG